MSRDAAAGLTARLVAPTFDAPASVFTYSYVTFTGPAATFCHSVPIWASPYVTFPRPTST